MLLCCHHVCRMARADSSARASVPLCVIDPPGPQVRSAEIGQPYWTRPEQVHRDGLMDPLLLQGKRFADAPGMRERVSKLSGHNRKEQAKVQTATQINDRSVHSDDAIEVAHSEKEK